jgi:hypothetical protein
MPVLGNGGERKSRFPTAVVQTAVIVLGYELPVLYSSDAPFISVLNYCILTTGL